MLWAKIIIFFPKKFDKNASAKKTGSRKLDKALREEVKGFILSNKDILAKGFKKSREAGFLAGVALRDLQERYGATTIEYKGKIKDKKELQFFKAARSLWIRSAMKGSYLCAGGDEELAMNMMSRFAKDMEKNSKWLHDESHKPKAASVWEGYLRECRYNKSAIKALLYGYAKNKERKKYNALALRVIKEDQVEFDYMYDLEGEIDNWLYAPYTGLLRQKNSGNEQLLSKEDLKMITSTLLTKHTELFNFEREYFKTENGRFNEYYLPGGVSAIVTFVHLLQKNGLYETSDQVINKFLLTEAATWTIDIYKKDFAEYMKKWEAAGRKSRDVKVIF